MAYRSAFFLIIFLFISLFIKVHSAEFISKFNRSELLQLARLSRESVKAVIKRRPVRESPVGVNLAKSGNGVFLHIVNAGQITAQGNGFGSSIVANIRLAAGNSVYNKNIKHFDKSAVFTEICGKGRKIPMPIFYKWRAGCEAYYVQYKTKKLYIPALEPVLNNWSWRETLLEIAKRALMPQNSQISKNDLIKIIASKDFKLTAYPVQIVASKGVSSDVKVLNCFDLPKKAVERKDIKSALLELAQWYRDNQSRVGRYPIAVNTVNGLKADASAEYIDALNIVALSKLADYLEDKDLEFRASRALDSFLINNFLENPENEEGYIKGKEGVSLIDSAAALWAIASMGLDGRNKEIAQISGRLGRFIMSMRQESGEFMPWYQPKGKRAERGEYAAIAILSLLNWHLQQHSQEVLKSADYYKGFYTSAAGAHPPMEVIGWYTEAASMVYGHTQQRAYAQWIFEINSVLARYWLKYRSLDKKKASTAYDVALVVLSLSEALYLQKLTVSSGHKAGGTRLVLFEKALNDALAFLLHLQIKSGAELWLMKEPQKNVGAFKQGVGSFQTRLIGNLMSVLALQKALVALDGADY